MALDGKIQSPFLYVVGCLVLIGIVADIFGCEYRVRFENDKPINTSVGGSNYEILEHKFCYGQYGIRSICGTVINKSNRKLDYAQISFSLFDVAGNQIGSTFDNINHWAPGATWKFNAVLLENNVDSYKLEEVSGF